MAKSPEKALRAARVQLACRIGTCRDLASLCTVPDATALPDIPLPLTGCPCAGVGGASVAKPLWRVRGPLQSAVVLCKVALYKMARPALARLLRLLQSPPSLSLPRPPNPAWPLLAQFGPSHVHSAIFLPTHSAISIIFIRLRATVHALLPPQTPPPTTCFSFLSTPPGSVGHRPSALSPLAARHQAVPLSVVGSLLARGSPTLSTLVGLARPGSPCLPAPPLLWLDSGHFHPLLFFPGSPALSRPGSIIISPVFPLQYASFLPCPFSLTETKQHPHALTTSSPVSPRTRWSFYPSSLTPT